MGVGEFCWILVLYGVVYVLLSVDYYGEDDEDICGVEMVEFVY